MAWANFRNGLANLNSQVKPLFLPVYYNNDNIRKVSMSKQDHIFIMHIMIRKLSENSHFRIKIQIITQTMGTNNVYYSKYARHKLV